MSSKSNAFDVKIVVDLILKFKRKGVFIEEFNGQLKITGQTSVLTDADKNEIKELKSEILLFLNKKNTDGGSYSEIIPVEKKDNYPLSSSQRRLWVLSQFEEGKGAYNQPGVFVFKGSLNAGLLQASLNEVVLRHEILRTRFKEDGSGDIRQFIDEFYAEMIELKEIDIHSFSNGLSGIKDRLQNEIIEPFNLETGPLIRVNLYKINNHEWIFCFVMHHIISDGWSIGVLINELVSFYNLKLNGKKEPLAALQFQYKDYAAWQQNHLKTNASHTDKEYWLGQFKENAPALDIPSPFTRPAVKTYNGKVSETFWSKEFTKPLNDFCKANDGTLFMGLLSCFATLIFRYTGKKDFVIGTPVAGRQHADLENQMGVYINTLPLRIKLSENDTFLQLFSHIKETTLSAYKHQSYPFDELIDELNVKRDTSRSPLFDYMLSLHNTSSADLSKLKLGDVEISEYKEIEHRASKLDITFNFEENENGVKVWAEYNSDCFDKTAIERILKHLRTIATELVKKAETPLIETDFISAEERFSILSTFNNTHRDYDKRLTAIDLFKEQVNKFPEKTCLLSGNQKLTYLELDRRSDQLAAYLISLGIKAEMFVPVCLRRDEHLLIALLGVFKAGGVYIPLDPQLPLNRIIHSIESTNAAVVLYNDFSFAGHSFPANVHLINIDDKKTSLHTQPAHEISEKINSSQAAYMIYTSGSTGNPKGVLIEHSSLTNFILSMRSCLNLKENDHLLSVTSVSFDISLLELLHTVCSGITVTIKEENKSVSGFNEYLHSANQRMDFSLFYFSSQEVKSGNKYDLLLKSVVYADENKFSACWIPERHFHEFGGIFPNPSVVGAALSTITNSLEIRSGSIVLPLHDTIRVAEEWAIVDNLSKGRVALSIASGWHANDFVLSPDSYSDRKKNMFNQIEELKKLWKGETVKRTNGAGNEIEIKVFPRPIQNDLQIWITTAGNEETYKEAGKIGAHILTHLLGQDIDELASNILAYKKSLAENGFDPAKAKIALMLHTFIGKDIDVVKAQVKEPFKTYLKSSIGLIKNLAKDMDVNPETLSESDIDELLNIGFERYWQTSALLGTMQSCNRLVEKLCAIGVTEVAALIDFGLENEIVLSGLDDLNELKKKFDVRESEITQLRDNVAPVNTLQATPSYINLLLEDEHSSLFIESLKHIIAGGEKFPESLAKKLSEKTKAEIYNMYGPTETTIWSASGSIVSGTPVSIGKPIQNTRIYILDANKNICPVGIPGDLYIAGDGLARGYFNDEVLTNEKFSTLTFAEHLTERLYKTGDTARWKEDGTIDLIGRSDDQLKINGYRIEPGEIENALRSHESVNEAAVIGKENSKGEKHMVAFIVTRNTISISEIRNFLLTKLPPYCVPDNFVELKQMPLMVSGKTDRKALQSHEGANLASVTKYAAPETTTEKMLAGIWSEVLGINKEKIGTRDNFFDLGGNSLKMIRVMSLINKKINRKLSLVNAYGLPNISSLSAFINEQQPAEEQGGDKNMDALFNTMEESFNLINSNKNGE
ncbi:MAG: LLM class flavin-dependent oxidoreductase [Bacteroidia bacterium]|nr:LLM class flavin-dependent oxidoreductase [Bacteroidia bacterium]